MFVDPTSSRSMSNSGVRGCSLQDSSRDPILKFWQLRTRRSLSSKVSLKHPGHLFEVLCSCTIRTTPLLAISLIMAFRGAEALPFWARKDALPNNMTLNFPPTLTIYLSAILARVLCVALNREKRRTFLAFRSVS